MPSRQYPQWDSLPTDVLRKWREDDVTRAFADELRTMGWQTQQAIMTTVEKGGDARVAVGSVRAFEDILGRMFAAPLEAAITATAEEPFVDPADVFGAAQ